MEEEQKIFLVFWILKATPILYGASKVCTMGKSWLAFSLLVKMKNGNFAPKWWIFFSSKKLCSHKIESKRPFVHKVLSDFSMRGNLFLWFSFLMHSLILWENNYNLIKQTREYILPVTFSLCSVYNGLPGSNKFPGLYF